MNNMSKDEVNTGIDFSFEHWKRVRTAYQQWWDGTLGRPLLNIPLRGCNPGRPPANRAFKKFTAHYDSSVSAEDIVDIWDYSLSGIEFMGDSFPSIFPNFGPGVIAAFLGADLNASNDTIWFHPKENKPIDQLSFTYDANNGWLSRIRDIMQAALMRWKGLVQVSMTDLGGNLDMLASFRPGESLLFDLYDHPTEVKRLTWEMHELWVRYYEELHSVLRPLNPGYTAWAPIYSAEPFYMLQCDFCYMISPDMFDEFVKPELVESCRKIHHTFYHLDGPGQLPHLDSLLDIDDLDGIQWIPGTGAKHFTEWPEVYRKISEAGKKIQIYGSIDELNIIADQIGCADNIICISGYDQSRREELQRGLKAHGCQ